MSDINNDSTPKSGEKEIQEKNQVVVVALVQVLLAIRAYHQMINLAKVGEAIRAGTPKVAMKDQNVQIAMTALQEAQANLRIIEEVKDVQIPAVVTEEMTAVLEIKIDVLKDVMNIAVIVIALNLVGVAKVVHVMTVLVVIDQNVHLVMVTASSLVTQEDSKIIAEILEVQNQGTLVQVDHVVAQAVVVQVEDLAEDAAAVVVVPVVDAEVVEATVQK